jgi:hypothetical protein
MSTLLNVGVSLRFDLLVMHNQLYLNEMMQSWNQHRISERIVAHLLHERTVEPEKQPLLSSTRAQQWKSSVFYHAATVAIQRQGKHAPSTREAVFSACSMPGIYLEDNWRYSAAWQWSSLWLFKWLSCHCRIRYVRSIFSSERMLHKDYYRKGSVEKTSGRESQGAWLQDELIGGKPQDVM